MFDADRIALRMLAARRARQVLGRLDDGPRNVADALAVQVALARRTGAWPPAGFKIGATAAAMQQYLGVAGPMAGFMGEAGLHASGSTLRWDGFMQPGVECELAVVLAHPLPDPCTPDEAMAAVAELRPAIELVERRGTTEPLHILSDQALHAGAVLGAPLDGWRDLDLASLPGRMEVDGAHAGAGQGSDLLGGPMQALAWLAGSEEAAAFGGLQAGQVVLLGSVTPVSWLHGPAAVRVAFGAGTAAMELT